MNYVSSTGEAERLECVKGLLIEGSHQEHQFDQIALMARDLFTVPIALVSIVGGRRQWLKARVGLDVAETSRDSAFCSITIMSPDPFVVLDARLDLRFRDNPLVKGAPFIRFYAGAPLQTSDGFRIGSLCIIDTKPREGFSLRDQRHLASLADICVGEIERRLLLIQATAAKGFAEASTDVVLFCNPDGRLTYINHASEVLLGYSPSELVGQNISNFIPERFIAGHKAGMSRIAAGASSKLSNKTIEATVKRKDGSEIPVDLAIKMWRDENGLNIGASMRDISERKAREARLEHLARTDRLTGLMVGKAFEELIAEKVEKNARATLMLLDLNGFKGINDSLGHAAGDDLLRAFAIRLMSVVDQTSSVARLGGDEFAVLIPAVADPLLAEACAVQLQSAFTEPFDVGGHKIFVGCSIGCAMAPTDAIQAHDLMVAADLALYRAKNTRRLPFQFFQKTMRDEALAARELHDRVRKGLEQNEFVMLYQPQVLLDGQRIVAAEALMRWFHPKRGLLFPDSFLSTMESTSLALSAGYWSLKQACIQLSSLRTKEISSIRIGVNLFAAQIRHSNLITILEEMLERYCFAPHLLELEITEDIACQENESVVKTLKRVRDLGIGIALDDFGTGYASLRTLKHVPATTVKIDRSFVRDLVTAREDAAIISAIMHVARSLNLRVIAEGVETKEQEVFLRVMGCHLGQGYLYGHAVSADDFSQSLVEEKSATQISVNSHPPKFRRGAI